MVVKRDRLGPGCGWFKVKPPQAPYTNAHTHLFFTSGVPALAGFGAARILLLGMLHPHPGFRLGWEQEGGHLIAGTAGDIWGLICITFIWKNFPSCSEN